MRYQQAIRTHGLNEDIYWKCIRSCTDCCRTENRVSRAANNSLFDVWRHYALANPERKPIYDAARENFNLFASYASVLINNPKKHGLSGNKRYPVFSHTERCAHLNYDDTGCKVHDTVLQGPNCLGYPEFYLLEDEVAWPFPFSLIPGWPIKIPRIDAVAKREHPCIAGKELEPEYKKRTIRLQGILQFELGHSFKLMEDFIDQFIRPDALNTVGLTHSHIMYCHLGFVPETRKQYSYPAELRYFDGLLEKLGGEPILTTQALARVIGEEGLEDKLRENGFEPVAEEDVDEFLQEFVKNHPSLTGGMISLA